MHVKRTQVLASLPGPHPASRCLQYSSCSASNMKLGKGLGTRLIRIYNWKFPMHNWLLGENFNSMSVS